MAASARMLPVLGGVLDYRDGVERLGVFMAARARHYRAFRSGKSFGIVDHGKPVPTNRIAADLECSRDATLTNLERLEAGNFIERSAAIGHAYEYKVQLLTE